MCRHNLEHLEFLNFEHYVEILHNLQHPFFHHLKDQKLIYANVSENSSFWRNKELIIFNAFFKRTVKKFFFFFFESTAFHELENYDLKILYKK